MEREARVFTADGERWRAVVARRAPGGHGLLYFLPLEGDEPADDDERDRRAVLGPDDELRALDDAGLRSLLGEARPLTATERRFRAPDGRSWLAQSAGPVWAEGGVAEGLTGVVFTSLEGPEERLAAPGGHVGEMDASELAGRWRAAARDEDDVDDEDESSVSAGGEAAGERRR